jgi:hypothetical protein
LERIANSTGILHVHHGDCCIHGARNVDFPRGWRKEARRAALIEFEQAVQLRRVAINRQPDEFGWLATGVL